MEIFSVKIQNTQGLKVKFLIFLVEQNLNTVKSHYTTFDHPQYYIVITKRKTLLLYLSFK